MSLVWSQVSPRAIATVVAALSVAYVSGPASAAPEALAGACSVTIDATVRATRIDFETPSPADCVISAGSVITDGSITAGWVTPKLTGDVFDCTRAVGSGSMTLDIDDGNNGFDAIDAEVVIVDRVVSLTFKKVNSTTHIVGSGVLVQTPLPANACATPFPVDVQWEGVIVFEDPVL